MLNRLNTPPPTSPLRGSSTAREAEPDVVLPGIVDAQERPEPRTAKRDRAARGLMEQLCRTPSPEGRRAMVCNPFLANVMGRPDLAHLATLLDQKCHQWAFTGSIALQIHGHVLGYADAIARVANDADVVTTDTGKSNLCDTVLPTGGSRGNPIQFTDTLSVDVVAASRKRTEFGSLSTDVVYIHGVPVMSLKALLRSKQSALDHARDLRNQPMADKALKDIALLKHLLEISPPEDTPSPVAPQRTLATGKPSSKVSRQLAFGSSTSPEESLKQYFPIRKPR